MASGKGKPKPIVVGSGIRSGLSFTVGDNSICGEVSPYYFQIELSLHPRLQYPTELWTVVFPTVDDLPSFR